MIATAAVAIFCAGSPKADVDLPQIFAGCIGRFSAEMERAWLMSQADADHFEAQRAAFQTLLEAVVAQEDRRGILTYRIETKMAHASLLTAADFGVDRARAERARRIAQMHVASCERMLLGT